MIAEIQKLSDRNIQVRIARTAEEKLQVFKHRYDLYVLGMGRDKHLADHEAKILTDQLDDTAVIIAAFDGDRVVGSGRVNFSYLVEFPEDELYGFSQYEAEFPGQLSLTSKVMVAPEYRGTRIFLEMARLMFKEASKRGMKRHFIATADHLVPLFKKLGFAPHRPRFAQWLDYGSSNPMMMNPFDLKHLESVRSPFLEDAAYFCQREAAIRQARSLPNNTPRALGLLAEARG